MTTRSRRPSHDQQGRFHDQQGLSPSLELVVLLPALMIMLGLIIGGGRIWFTRTAITEAAYSGARAASLQRDPAAARSAGRQASAEQLRMEGVRCHQRSIVLDVSGFDGAEGDRSSVVGRIRCRVGLDDLILPGMPGSLQLSGRGTAVIDHYRER